MDVEDVVSKFIKDVKDVFASKKAVNVYVYDASLETIRELVGRGYTLGSVQGSGSGIRAFASKTEVVDEFEVSCTVYSESITLEKYFELRKALKE